MIFATTANQTLGGFKGADFAGVTFDNSHLKSVNAETTLMHTVQD